MQVFKIHENSNGVLELTPRIGAQQPSQGKLRLDNGEILDLQKYSLNEITIVRQGDHAVLMLPDSQTQQFEQLMLIDFFAEHGTQNDSIPLSQSALYADTASIKFSEGYLHAKQLSHELTVPITIYSGNGSETVLVAADSKLYLRPSEKIDLTEYKDVRFAEDGSHLTVKYSGNNLTLINFLESDYISEHLAHEQIIVSADTAFSQPKVLELLTENTLATEAVNVSPPQTDTVLQAQEATATPVSLTQESTQAENDPQIDDRSSISLDQVSAIIEEEEEAAPLPEVTSSNEHSEVEAPEATLPPPELDDEPIEPTNIAPTISAPNAQSLIEDIAEVFNSANGNLIQLNDADAGGAEVQLSLTVDSGHLTLSQTTALTFMIGSGSADPVMLIKGSLASINAALDGMIYTPPTNYSGAASLSLVADDLGNGGTTGNLIASETISLTVNAVNDAPTQTIPGTQSVAEDTPLVFSTGNGNALSVSDIDDPSASVQVTLTATNGTITLSGTTGLSFSIGSGTNESTMTFSGTQANINAALEGMSFVGSNDFNGSASLQMLTNDLGNSGSGGNLTASDTVTINVSAVNDAPTQTIPGTQSVAEDTPLVFSSGNGNALSVSDIDDPSASVQVTLTATNGTITLSGTTGLSFSVGSGTNESTMTFSGTQANINAALEGMSFVGSNDFNGSASLQMLTNDLGNSGSGGNLTASDTVTINVSAVNDAPTLSGLTNTTFTESISGSNTITLDSSITFNDVDSGDLDGGTIVIAIAGHQSEEILNLPTSPAAADGNVRRVANDVQYHDGGWVSIGTIGGAGNTGVGEDLTITLNSNATVTRVNALLEQLTYTSSDYNPSASRTLSFTVTDGDGASTTTETLTLNITAVANSLTLTGSNDNFTTDSENDTFITTEASFASSDVISAGAGSDTLRFTGNATITTAELANKSGIDILELQGTTNTVTLSDAFVFATDSNTLEINQGNNTLSLDASAINITRDIIIAGTGTVTLSNNGERVLSKAGVDTTIHGGSGNDTIIGDNGDDEFHAGSGQDTLTGGDGNDTFVWNSATESDPGSADQITDFKQSGDSDKIDINFNNFMVITGDTGSGAVWTNQAGEIIWFDDTVNTYVQIDTDGDGSANFGIQLNGIADASTVVNSDFIFHNFQGTLANDSLNGDGTDNILDGDRGDDTLIGNAGNDTLIGGYGADTISGGLGNDVIFADKQSFSNSSISNMAIWLDASDINGDGSSVDGPVSNWADKSGNGYSVLQGDGSKQASTSTSGLNGRHSLSFDGSDFFDSNYIASLNQSAFIVYSSTDDSAHYMFGSIDGTNGRSYAIRQEGYFTGAGIKGDVSSSSGLQGTTDHTAFTPSFTGFSYDISDNVELYYNGDLETATTITNTGSPVSTQNYYFGAANSNDNSALYPHLGDISEIIIFDKFINTEERRELSEYFALKYSINVRDDSAISYGHGADTLSGDEGDDTFVWTNASHSGVGGGSRDIITDFKQGNTGSIDLSETDQIDLSDLNLTFIGTDVFTGMANSLRYSISGSDIILEIDFGGDLGIDMEIELQGLSSYALRAEDFVGVTYGNDYTITAGNDTFTGDGGDDEFTVSNAADIGGTDSHDGNAGFDTLILDTGVNIDLNIVRSYLHDFEQIDLSAAGANTLTLTASDLTDITDSNNLLFIEGDGSDSVTLTGGGWTLNSNSMLYGQSYAIYDNGATQIYIDEDISLTVL